MEIDSIMDHLAEIGSRCNAEAEKTACTEAAGILFTLGESGVKTLEEATDLVYDYNALAKQYQVMHKRFGVAEHVVRKDGVWHCPSCNRRANQYHSYCHSCGQKLDWGGGKGGRRYG